VHLFAWNWGLKLPILREVLRRLGPEYVAVRPDHLAALYQAHLAREQVLLTFPAAIPAVDGWDAFVGGRVQNTSASPIDLQFTISGIDNPQMTPQSASLQSAESLAISLSGRPVGERLVVECRGTGLTRRAEIAWSIVRRPEIVGKLPSQGSLHFECQFPAVQLSHRSGRNVTDAQAGTGEAWQAEPGHDESGHIVFGPYRQLPPGKAIVAVDSITIWRH
jgi:hypothetical protein